MFKRRGAKRSGDGVHIRVRDESQHMKDAHHNFRDHTGVGSRFTRAKLLICFSAVILLGTTILMISLRGRSRELPTFELPPAQWVAVAADEASRDAAILDAALADLLTNPQLARHREFYGGADVGLVEYAGFPSGYEPKVSGFRFKLHSPKSGGTTRPKQLIVGLGGYWLDRSPATNELAHMFTALTRAGLVLTIWSSGGGAIGSGFASYEVERAGNGWALRYAGYEDP